MLAPLVVSFESERRTERKQRGNVDMNRLPAKGSGEDDEESVDRTLDLVGRMIVKIEEQLDRAEVKGSIADYIKLLQLQKDLEEKRVRRIEVKWVEAE